ncbi:MAG: fumarylacetoacetate hydrolase family protein [Kiloniellales bacterium]
MKLASLKQGRDGRLALVSRDLSRAVLAQAAETLQAALDDWAAVAAKLAEEAAALEDGRATGAFTFEESACAAPLPRAYQWADGSAYVNHVKLVRQARGAELPESFWEDPLMYQGGSDSFLGPQDPIDLADEAWGLDLEAEIAVVTDDVPRGVTARQAAGHIKLIMLVNDVSLRNLIPGELAKGFGFFQAKPSSAFSPVALTPEELGEAWDGRRLHLPLLSRINGAVLGKPNAAEDMTFDFPTLIAHAAKTRPLTAGSIIGSGTVSNRDADGGPGKPVDQGGLGYACLAEVRMVEKIRTGEIATPFLTFGDRVRIEMLGADGESLFGAIDQEVRRHAER